MPFLPLRRRSSGSDSPFRYAQFEPHKMLALTVSVGELNSGVAVSDDATREAQRELLFCLKGLKVSSETNSIQLETEGSINVPDLLSFRQYYLEELPFA